MSITQQIRDALAASDEPLTAAQLAEQCSEAQDTTQIANACHTMVERGEITREKPPEGGRFRYRLAGSPPPAAPDDEQDATEARASRVTPSEKPNGSGSGPRAHARGRRRSVALPVPGKAPPGSAGATCARVGRRRPTDRDHRGRHARAAPR
jgi:hypothetical protein